MTEQSVVYIQCPGCECAVFKLDATRCPNCSRCVFCGRKLKTDGSICDCASSVDPDPSDWYLAKLIIPEDQVARETRRMEIRKQLENRKSLAAVFVLLPMFVSVEIVSHIFDKFTWSWFGAYFICVLVVIMPLLAFIPWVFRRIEDHRLQLQDDLLNES